MPKPAHTSGMSPPILLGTPRPPDSAQGALRGAILLGIYRLDALLGQGPSGKVYNAWNVRRQTPCAVKVLKPELAALTAALVRLRHDNQEIGGLHHPHLQGGAADLHFTEDGIPILVRELWHGESLRQRLLRGPLRLPELSRLFVVLCGALDAAHAHGVIHGDLKPENLILGHLARGPAEDTLQILDFGMHHLRHGEGGIGTHPLLGPLSYLAPEQLGGDEAAIGCEAAPRLIDREAPKAPRSVDGRADVFSLGALLHECLTGAVAFGAPQAAAVISLISLGEAPRPSQLLPGLAPALDAVVEMACHKSPDERFASPSALWLALLNALSGEADVEEALGDLRGPSAASSTVVLLHDIDDLNPDPEGEEGQEEDQPGQALHACPSKRVFHRRRRTSNGARAIKLFKELEATGKDSKDEASAEIRRAAAEQAALLLDSAQSRQAHAQDRREVAQSARVQSERESVERYLIETYVPPDSPARAGPPTDAADPPSTRSGLPQAPAGPPADAADPPSTRSGLPQAPADPGSPFRPAASQPVGPSSAASSCPSQQSPSVAELLAGVRDQILSPSRVLPLLLVVAAVVLLAIFLTRRG